MRISHYQSGEAAQPRVAVAASESFGRIAARRPKPAVLRHVASARPTAAGGAAPLSPRLEAAARAERARLVGDLALSAWRHVAATARRLQADWLRRRSQRATYLALRALDDRTLHDLGYGRGEILSVALDLHRDDQASRLRSMRAAHALRLF